MPMMKKVEIKYIRINEIKVKAIQKNEYKSAIDNN